MKNPEQAIEKLLAGLRNADVPPGMEGRVLKALQDRASAQPLSGWRRLRPLWLTTRAARVATLSAACGVAGVLTLVLMIPAIRRVGHAPALSRSSLAPSQQLPSPAPIVTEAAQSPTSVSTPHQTGRPSARRTPPAHVDDLLAEREMRAASLPEPPMPLTDQEKLLLRIVHSNNPVELAQLDSTTWAARNAEEKAAFERFFEPPKTEATGGNK